MLGTKHQLGQRPNKRVDTIRRVAGLTAVEVRGEGGHLFLELREHARVMHAALLIKRARRQSGQRDACDRR